GRSGSYTTNVLKVQNPTDANKGFKLPLFCMFLVKLVFFDGKMFDASVLARSITKCKILYY
ncbi:unnamed protein product, partial [marine sediment metagenome]